MNNKNTLYVLILFLTMFSMFHCETVKVTHQHTHIYIYITHLVLYRTSIFLLKQQRTLASSS